MEAEVYLTGGQGILAEAYLGGIPGTLVVAYLIGVLGLEPGDSWWEVQKGAPA